MTDCRIVTSIGPRKFRDNAEKSKEEFSNFHGRNKDNTFNTFLGTRIDSQDFQIIFKISNVVNTTKKKKKYKSWGQKMNLQALLKKMEAILNDQLKNLIQETTSPLQEQKNQAEIESQLEQNFFSDNDAIKKKEENF